MTKNKKKVARLAIADCLASAEALSLDKTVTGIESE